MLTRSQRRRAEASLSGLENSIQQNAQNSDQPGTFLWGQKQSQGNDTTNNDNDRRIPVKVIESQSKGTHNTCSAPNDRSPLFQFTVDPITSLPMLNNIENLKSFNFQTSGSPCRQNANLAESKYSILLPSNLVPLTDFKFDFKYGLKAFSLWVNLSHSNLACCPKRFPNGSYDPLQMTSEELCYLLCRFIEEVRQPDGSQFSAVELYYFVLGLQRFFNLSNRVDNIFVDACYEPFVEKFHTKINEFLLTYPNSPLAPVLVIEEHLWHTEQLGALSPWVLLKTILFLNMKFFGIKTVEEHKQLSFMKVLECMKWNSGNSCSVFFSFTVKKQGGESESLYHRENDENPLRCPVRLLEYYMLKCPNVARNRNWFYLEPETSCVPDSQIWYTSKPVSEESLQKVLNLYRMVNV